MITNAPKERPLTINHIMFLRVQHISRICAGRRFTYRRERQSTSSRLQEMFGVDFFPLLSQQKKRNKKRHTRRQAPNTYLLKVNLSIHEYYFTGMDSNLALIDEMGKAYDLFVYGLYL